MDEMIVTGAEAMISPYTRRIVARPLFDAGPRFRVFAEPINNNETNNIPPSPKPLDSRPNIFYRDFVNLPD